MVETNYNSIRGSSKTDSSWGSIRQFVNGMCWWLLIHLGPSMKHISKMQKNETRWWWLKLATIEQVGVVELEATKATQNLSQSKGGISHPNTPWRCSTITPIPFSCLPKYLQYLYMENHILGETLTFRLYLVTLGYLRPLKKWD
jgi:hypothetical protein